MLKITILATVILFGFMALNADDVIFREIRSGYHPLETAFMTSPRIPDNIPEGKFLRLTISYVLNEKPENFSLVINAPLQIDAVYFSITAIKGIKPHLYIIGLKKIASRYDEIIKYSRLLSNKKCNVIDLYYNGNLYLELGKETVLCRTFKDGKSKDCKKFSAIRRGYYFDSSFDVEKLPDLEFKIKAELVDSPEMFLLTKDLTPHLKDLSLTQQQTWLLKERDKRLKEYRKHLATLGDVNIIQKYLRETDKKLKNVNGK